MSRWEPGAPSRLERAALELYAERGFEQTTVAEIAKRAGLTERTFYRHYADKREVLFAGGEVMRELLVDTLESAPASEAPIDSVSVAFQAVGAVLDERRDYASRRSAVIAATAELQERELSKLSGWSSAIAEALRGRGVPEPAASLTAQAGMAVFRVSFERWVSDTGSGKDFAQVFRESLDALKAVTAGS